MGDRKEKEEEKYHIFHYSFVTYEIYNKGN